MAYTGAIAVTHMGAGNIYVNSNSDINSASRSITTFAPGTGTTNIKVNKGTIKSTQSGVHVDNGVSYAGAITGSSKLVTIDIEAPATIDAATYAVFANVASAANVVVNNKGTLTAGPGTATTAVVNMNGNLTYQGAQTERMQVNNTGTITAKNGVNAGAVFTTNAGLDLINDGSITGVIRSTVGTNPAFADLGISDTILLRAGSVKGNVRLGTGDDIGTWSGGTYAGSFMMDTGSDTLTVTTANISDTAAILDGGDDTSSADGMIDTLTIKGVSAAVQGANLRNWENVVLDGAQLSFTDNLLVTGADAGVGAGMPPEQA